MVICKHPEWLHVAGGKEIALINTGRLTRIVGELTHPATQQPSVLLFIGRKAKNLALRELFPNHVKKGPYESIVTLRVDNTSLYSDHPVFFAESDPSATVLSASNASCHETESFPVRWANGTTVHHVYDILHARIFCPFSDVLCIFADDFPNFSSVVDRLKVWAIAGAESSPFEQARPSVVIVKRGGEASASPTHDLLEMQDVQFSLNQKVLKDFYSSIKVLHLADEQISPLARFRRLKELLWRQMDEMRDVRSRRRCLYSAVHLNKFFQIAVSQTAVSAVRPFNFVTASRLGNEVGPDHFDHLTSFLRFGTYRGLSNDTMASFIASSILLDAYPPNMHREYCTSHITEYKLIQDLDFDPKTVYDVIYHPACHRSLVGSFKEQSYAETEAVKQAEDQEQCIKRHLATYFVDMTLSKPAAQVHRENVSGLDIPWLLFQSNSTCVWCVRRKPENPLSCGHAICDMCVRIYGDEMPIMDCQYHIKTCLLCRSGNCTVRLKPFPAGERILAIDGGGTRGVIPLEIMTIIQGMIGSELQIQDFFDIAFGTSVGGLIVCILFLRGMPVSQCVHVFDALARKLFARPRGRMNFIKRLRLSLKGWYRDGHYDANALEDCLKEYLGIDDRMFGYQPGIHATKVGIIAATIGNASPVIFTNYNGPGARKEDCGYTHVRPEKVEDEPCIWEAGRATSAAPVLYRSAQIKTSGPVQDGGMSGHNNPVRIALSERLRNDPYLLAPDVVVSLGTGAQKTSTSPRTTDFRHVILDGYVPRLWRSYMSSFNGQKIWDELMNFVDERKREDFIRLNSVLPSDQPAIDNIDRMDELRESVHVPQMYLDCTKTLYALLITAFYFELTSVPERLREGQYHCRGTIRCRLPGNSVVKLLARCGISNLEFITDIESLGHYGGNLDLCLSCHRYQKKVDFLVRHPTQLVTIYAQSVTQGRRKISAFPQAMQWFENQQKLDASFGTAFHRDLLDRSCKSCIPNISLKRPTLDGHHKSQMSKKPRLGPQFMRSLLVIPEEHI